MHLEYNTLASLTVLTVGCTVFRELISDEVTVTPMLVNWHATFAPSAENYMDDRQLSL